jgi:hypothetical protein
MKEMILVKSLKDFGSRRFLFFSLAPFLIPIILLSTLFYFGGSEFSVLLIQGSESGDFSFLDETQHPILAFLLGFSVVHWIILTLLGVFGTLGVVLISLVIAMVIVGFLTPLIIKNVRQRHYPKIEPAKGDTLFKSLSNMAIIFLKFLAIFLICLPFLMLPFVSFFILNIPFFYLFYKFLLYDIISNGISKDAYTIVHEHKFYLLFVLVLFFTLSLIPFVGLFLQVFFVTYLSHFFLSKSN